MKRTIRWMTAGALLVPALALARPNDRDNPPEPAAHRAQELSQAGRSTGGPDSINSNLRTEAEQLWARTRRQGDVAQLTGPVVKAQPRTLYVRSAGGAVVPFDVSQLRFIGRSPVQEGIEVRVTFAREGKRNLATGLERVIEGNGLSRP